MFHEPEASVHEYTRHLKDRIGLRGGGGAKEGVRPAEGEGGPQLACRGRLARL